MLNNGEEVELKENIDYGESDYRFEMEGDRKYDDYDSDSLGEMGYQKQEFDEESGELVSADDEDFEDNYTDDDYTDDDAFEGDDDEF